MKEHVGKREAEGENILATGREIKGKREREHISKRVKRKEGGTVLERAIERESMLARKR